MCTTLSHMRAPCSVLLVCYAAACTAGQPGIYAGALQPQSGTCDPPVRAELSLRGSAVLFTPSSGTLVLRGERVANEITARFAMTTPEHKPYAVSFAGQFAGAGIDGTYANAALSLPCAPFPSSGAIADRKSGRSLARGGQPAGVSRRPRSAATRNPIPWPCHFCTALWSAPITHPSFRHENRCRSVVGLTRLRASTIRRST